ncbi:MAG: hypothetical protein Kow00108_14370 [Calditrichia bacterium]
MKDMVAEKQRRGMFVFGSALVLWVVMAGFMLIRQTDVIFRAMEIILFLIVIALFLKAPIRRRAGYPLYLERVDERDVMFSRAARKQGTLAYQHYYSIRPHFKKVDDHLRALPGLCTPKSLFYEPEPMKEADRYFEEIETILPDPVLIRDDVQGLSSAKNKEKWIKEYCKRLGAVDTGITGLTPTFIYTYKGRQDHHYGKKIELNHRTIIVFLVEMDFDTMQQAPYAPTIRESARQYYRAAVIAKHLEAVLKEAGYDAKAQYDAHYDVILPPLAELAGIGEVGRNNLLISRHHGPRVRIGAVTTNLILTPDRPIALGADYFCEICKKCATGCPSRSLNTGEKKLDRGVFKWTTSVETCYGLWRRFGTDCGICMIHCPYSKPNTFMHRLIRKAISKSKIMARLALAMDDLVYGKEWHYTPSKNKNLF